MLRYFRNSFLEKIVKSNTFLLLLSDRIIEKFNFLLPYESDWSFFKKFKIKKNSSILDIGAHWGESALTLTKLYPENKIYSFEPNVDSFRKLRINCKNFNIFPFNYGISKKSEKKKIFYPTYKNQSLSLWSSDNLLNLKKRIEQFTYLKHKNIIFKSQLCLFKKLPKIKEKISIIKIDVEGAEHKVIESIFGLIKRDKPLLFIEYNKLNFDEIYKRLNKINYNSNYYNEEEKKLVKIYNPNTVKNLILTRKKRTINLIFCSK